MCLVFFLINQHPVYKFILAANRDEFYKRKTAPADFWTDYPHVLGGRDLEALAPKGICGTWIGINTKGKIALITNFRDPKNINPNAPSRGQLVSDFLINESDPFTYLTEVEKRGKQYNGFNLVAGTSDELLYFSNYKNEIERIHSGFFGLSNHLMNTPWPKVILGKKKMMNLLDQGQAVEPEELFELLYDETPAIEKDLPDTGVGLKTERVLSPMFIKSPNYGTRCSTVILIDKNENVQFFERNYHLQNFSYDTRTFRFKIA